MLDRRHRLTTSAGFTTATRRGRRAGTRTLVLHLFMPAGSMPPGSMSSESPECDSGARVGFVVGRAVGNAVTRNRVRRRLRHLARERIGSVPDAAVLVVRALPASAGATYRGLSQDFDAALRRVDISVGTVDGR